MLPVSFFPRFLSVHLILQVMLILAGYSQDRLFISEIVAVGDDSFQDEDGDTSDWLEIYNPTASAIDLSGYHLTDDAADLTKWTFPGFTLPSGGFLVIFASDKDRDLAGGQLHTNFKLSGSGEYLALIEPDGVTILSELAPGFPVQAGGFSYGVEGPGPCWWTGIL